MRIDAPTKIYIDNSPVHGLGVFAKEQISEGEIIETCAIIDLGLSPGESSPILIDYRFNWPQGNVVPTKQVVATGFSLIYNHSENFNANWRSNFETNCFEFYATKNISPGEEIFTWYGDVNYWNDGRTHTKVI